MLPSSPGRQLSLTGASTGSANPLVNEGAHDNGARVSNPLRELN